MTREEMINLLEKYDKLLEKYDRLATTCVSIHRQEELWDLRSEKAQLTQELIEHGCRRKN